MYNSYGDLYSLSILGDLGFVNDGAVRTEARASASDTRGDGVVDPHPHPALPLPSFPAILSAEDLWGAFRH